MGARSKRSISIPALWAWVEGAISGAKIGDRVLGRDVVNDGLFGNIREHGRMFPHQPVGSNRRPLLARLPRIVAVFTEVFKHAVNGKAGPLRGLGL